MGGERGIGKAIYTNCTQGERHVKKEKNPHWIHTSDRNNGKITQRLDMMLIYAAEVVKWSED